MNTNDNITWSFPLFNLFTYFMSWFAKRAQGAEGISSLVRVPWLPFVSLTYITAPNKDIFLHIMGFYLCVCGGGKGLIIFF